MQTGHENIEDKAFRIITIASSLFRSEQLNVDIKLTLHIPH